MVEVKVAGEGEVRVIGDRVRVVANQRVDPCLVGTSLEPSRVKVSDDCSSVDVVTVVEVVIVVERVSKVLATVTGVVRCAAGSTSPGLLVYKRELLLVVDESRHGNFQSL